jgi:hypothetical protein
MTEHKLFKCSVCDIEIRVRPIVKSIIKDLSDRSQYWIDQECPNSNDHYKILRARELKKIPIETKQKVLDLFHTGKCIGEIKEIVHLETMDVGEIISENIDSVKFLRTEAKRDG